MIKIYLYIFICFNLLLLLKCLDVQIPNEQNLERPCPEPNITCMQKLFMSKGWCTKESVHVNGELVIPEMTTTMAFFNVSFVASNVVIKGLKKGSVVEFYTNLDTGNTVLALDFVKFEFNANTFYHYHRPAKEDIIISSYSRVYYDRVITTTMIPEDAIDLHESYTHARIPEVPVYTFGEGTRHIDNEEVYNLLEDLDKHPQMALRELFVDRAPLMAKFYVEEVLCGNKEHL